MLCGVVLIRVWCVLFRVRLCCGVVCGVVLICVCLMLCRFNVRLVVCCVLCCVVLCCLGLRCLVFLWLWCVALF